MASAISAETPAPEVQETLEPPDAGDDGAPAADLAALEAQQLGLF